MIVLGPGHRVCRLVSQLNLVGALLDRRKVEQHCPIVGISELKNQNLLNLFGVLLDHLEPLTDDVNHLLVAIDQAD